MARAVLPSRGLGFGCASLAAALVAFVFVLFVYLFLTVEKNEAADQQAGVGQTASQSGNAAFLH